MKLYAKLPYDKVREHFLWECNRWDIALEGLCVINSELMYFTVPETYQGLCHNPPRLEVYKLNWFEKLRWSFRQSMFEICVGRHCTYPDRVQGRSFYYKSPRWFWRLVFEVYYAPLKFQMLDYKLRKKDWS